MRLAILFLLFAAPLFAMDQYADAYQKADENTRAYARKESRRVRDEIRKGGLLRAAELGDIAIDGLVKHALEVLTERGFGDYAQSQRFEYEETFKGYLTREWITNRGQGDHEALVQWMVNLYKKSCQLIGKTASDMLHICDLASYSWCIPVAFHPCTFPMDAVPGERIDEYRRHMAKDNTNDQLYGFTSITVFWIIQIGVMCTPAAPIAGIAASAGEFIMGKWIGPRLSDFIYNGACTPGYKEVYDAY